MIKALIVDDEAKARTSLHKLLKRYCQDVKVVATAESVEEAFEHIQNFKPQLVFLDIEMPEENGFQLLERFKNPNFEIIFTTAYADYALKAFRYAALDYLSKPIDFRLLIEAIGRFKEKQEVQFTHERMSLLLENLNNSPNTFEKIALSTPEGYLFEHLNNIVFCQASGSYTTVHLLDGREVLVSKYLKDLEELLPQETFFRTHKSYLVNLNLVQKYCREEDCVFLAENSKIPVATRLKKSFLERVSNNG